MMLETPLGRGVVLGYLQGKIQSQRESSCEYETPSEFNTLPLPDGVLSVLVPEACTSDNHNNSDVQPHRRVWINSSNVNRDELIDEYLTFGIGRYLAIEGGLSSSECVNPRGSKCNVELLVKRVTLSTPYPPHSVFCLKGKNLNFVVELKTTKSITQGEELIVRQP
jgi:hypothetical protein